MGRETFRKLPVSSYDVTGVEAWLEKMARQGYSLYDTWGSWYMFRIGEPEELRVRLEPIGNTGTPDPQKVREYEALGWRYVLTAGSEYHIFMTEDPEAEELHADGRVYLQFFRSIEKRLRGSLAGGLAVLLFYGVLWRRSILEFFRFPLLLEAEQGLAVPYLLLLLWFFFMQTQNFFAYVRVRRAGRLLEEERTLGRRAWEERRNRGGRAFNWVKGILLLLVAGTFFLDSCSVGTDRKEAFQEGQRSVLLELETDGKLELKEDSEGNSDYSIFSHRSPLLRRNYEFLEEGTSEGRFGESGEVYSPSAAVTYYEVRGFPVIWREFEREMEEKFLAPAQGRERIREVKAPGFDSYRLKREGGRQTLLARRGGQMILLEYEGEELLEERAQAVLAVLDSFLR